jgi:hypothetical protein
MIAAETVQDLAAALTAARTTAESLLAATVAKLHAA